MAQAAVRGAESEPDVDIKFIHAAEAGPDELIESDGYIFATPENLAMMSGIMKDFFDRTYYPVRAPDPKNRHRLAAQGDGRSDHCLHPRADAGSDPRAQTDR